MLGPTLLPVIALLASLVLLVTGNAMLGTVAALRLDIDGFDPGVIGVVLALTSLGFVLGSVHGVRIVRRVGHIRAFAAFAAIAAAAGLAHSLHVSAAGWMVFRFALGFCIAGLMLVTESWINGQATTQTRGALLATYMVLFFLAASSGQFLIGLGDPGMHHLFVIAAMFITLSLVPVSLTRFTPPELGTGGRLAFLVLWRRSELGLAGAAISGVALGAFGTLGPVYAYEMGLPVEYVAVFMGISILAAMVVQWPVGYLSDRVPRRMVIIGVAAAATSAALLTAAFGQRSTMHLYAGAAAMYGMAACIYPLCLAQTHDMLGKAEVVPANATLLLANGIGAVAGPVLGGIAISAFGPVGLMVFLALPPGVLFALSLHSLLRVRAPKVAGQSHCVGVAPLSTTAVLEMDAPQARAETAASSEGSRASR